MYHNTLQLLDFPKACILTWGYPCLSARTDVFTWTTHQQHVANDVLTLGKHVRRFCSQRFEIQAQPSEVVLWLPHIHPEAWGRRAGKQALALYFSTQTTTTKKVT